MSARAAGRGSGGGRAPMGWQKSGLTHSQQGVKGDHAPPACRKVAGGGDSKGGEQASWGSLEVRKGWKVRQIEEEGLPWGKPGLDARVG